MLTAKGLWLPGYTDGEPRPEVAEYLTKRNYDDPEGGPALFTALRSLLIGEVDLIVDCLSPDTRFICDPRNLILAGCIRENCKSAVWWMVSRQEEPKWSVYAASWNETYGVLVLESSWDKTPHLVISDDHATMREILDLSRV